MREIKFSYIWQRNETGRIVEQIWTLDHLQTGTVADQCDYDYRRTSTLVARRLFTGLQDVEGKDVYEGDVVCIPYYDYMPDDGTNPNQIAPVVWDKCRFCIGREPVETYENDILIIGNIYENPELLE